MADEEDEEVIFVNSPLEKYLKDAGFVGFEPEFTTNQTSYHENDNRNSGTVKSSGSNLLKHRLLSFVNNLFSCNYDVDKALTMRKKYASVIFSSRIMSEDDIGFLQQFDPELFDQLSDNADVKRHDFMRRLPKCGWLLNNIMPVLVLLLAMVLSTHYYEYFNGVIIAGIILTVACICYYMWRRQRLTQMHNQNVKILSGYVNDLKSFLTVFRKSVLLIQELELISKGYTLVGLGLHLGSQHSDNYQTDIYPMLRKCLLENGMNLLTPSCSFVQNIVLSNPLATEVNSVFTYISANPLKEFGLDKYSDNEKLSLQYLKDLLSVIASQQSELLSRYLLCLSENAKSQSKYCAFTFEELEILHEGFCNQLIITNTVLKSLQLSYHVHKSSLTFIGNDEMKHGTHEVTQKTQSKWNKYYTAIHSLELHLKACLTRTQSVTDFLISEMEAENNPVVCKKDVSSKENEMLCKDGMEQETVAVLESANVSLKMELGSTVSCLEECVSSLKILYGANEKNSTYIEQESSDEAQVENSTQKSSDYPNEERQETLEDCVFEAYTDLFDDDDDIHSPLLTREELEKESRSREESKHLLVELKNVLLTKTKDPLISEAGFVEPLKKQSIKTESVENLCVTSEKYKIKFDDENKDSKETNLQLPKPQQYKNDNTTKNRSDVIAPFPSRAFSSAIQAAALSRGLVMEESYGSSDSSDSEYS